MNAIPQIPPPAAWEELREQLAGSFTARSRGLLSNIFILYKNGLEVGRLTSDGRRGAEFATGTLKAEIENIPDGGYTLFSGGHRVLRAVPQTSSLDALEITRGNGVYQARISFLRNEAEAFSTAGRETVLLKGNVTGRKYEVIVDKADPGALPVAVLLLYHTIALRKRVYVA